MWNTRLNESQAVIKFAGRNTNNLRNADDTILLAESEEKLKSLLKIVKEESGKYWLKTQHSRNQNHGMWSHHFMVDRWGKVEAVVDLFSWVPKLLWMVPAAMKLKNSCSLKGKLWQT